MAELGSLGRITAMITFGNTPIDIRFISTFLILDLIWLLFFVADIWFVVQGFKVHWGWGVANLLIPCAVIVFCFLYFERARKPLGLVIIASVLLLFFWIFTKL